MNNLTYTQRAILRRRGIVVCIERADGACKCLTADGVRYYTVEDLVQMAEPGVVERLRGWIIGRAVA